MGGKPGQFKAGHQKFGGRAPGSKNKRTKRAQELADHLGVDPVKFLLELIIADSIRVVLTNPTTGEVVLDDKGEPVRIWQAIPLEMKADAAKAVAKYVHPALQATTLTGPNDGPLELAPVNMAQLLDSPEAIEAAQTLSLALTEKGTDPAPE